MDSGTDRGWWVVPVAFAGWMLAVLVAGIELGLAAAVLVWLLVPVALVLAAYLVELRDRRREREARRRHPAGSARDGRTWGEPGDRSGGTW